MSGIFLGDLKILGKTPNKMKQFPIFSPSLYFSCSQFWRKKKCNSNWRNNLNPLESEAQPSLQAKPLNYCLTVRFISESRFPFFYKGQRRSLYLLSDVIVWIQCSTAFGLVSNFKYFKQSDHERYF